MCLVKRLCSIKTIFVNDTSAWHEGSRACVDSLKYRLSRAGYIIAKNIKSYPNSWMPASELDEYDLLVVNGEGSIHDDFPYANCLMGIIRDAQAHGLHTYLVNAVWCRMDIDRLADVLDKLTLISLREPISKKEIGFDWPVLRLDSSADRDLIYDVDPSVDFNGQVVAGGFFTAVTQFSGPRQYIRNLPWSVIIANLKTASLYITGEHHGMYAAALAKVPFALLAGNTHKMQGLIEWSGIPIPVAQTFPELHDAIEWAKLNPKAFEDFFAWFDSRDVTRFPPPKPS